MGMAMEEYGRMILCAEGSANHLSAVSVIMASHADVRPRQPTFVSRRVRCKEG